MGWVNSIQLRIELEHIFFFRFSGQRGRAQGRRGRAWRLGAGALRNSTGAPATVCEFWFSDFFSGFFCTTRFYKCMGYIPRSACFTPVAWREIQELFIRKNDANRLTVDSTSIIDLQSLSIHLKCFIWWLVINLHSSMWKNSFDREWSWPPWLQFLWKKSKTRVEEQHLLARLKWFRQ